MTNVDFRTACVNFDAGLDFDGSAERPGRGVLGKHLVLDLDGTLLYSRCASKSPMSYEAPADFRDETIGLETVKRPGLDAFLEFCFSSFETVSVWTAAQPLYAEYVVKNICPPGRRFHSVRTIASCTLRKEGDGFAILKQLRNVWNKGPLRSMGAKKNNTIIIEDTPDTCRKNYGNAVYVTPYEGQASDGTLVWLGIYLARYVLPALDVRRIDKTWWIDNVVRMAPQKVLYEPYPPPGWTEGDEATRGGLVPMIYESYPALRISATEEGVRLDFAEGVMSEFLDCESGGNEPTEIDEDGFVICH